jgi:hypothetical protein
MRKMHETPEMRAMHSRLASHVRWAHEPDRTAATAPARAGLQERFEREVDPDGVMDPVERVKRVENLRKAYYTRLTYLSLQARLAKKLR